VTKSFIKAKGVYVDGGDMMKVWKLEEFEEINPDLAEEFALAKGKKKVSPEKLKELGINTEKGGIVAFRRGYSIIELESGEVYVVEGIIDVGKRKRKNADTSGVRKSRGVRGEKTRIILSEIKKLLDEKKEIRMGEAWRILKDKGLVKYRAHLYNVVTKHCSIVYDEGSKRREIIIKGVNL